MNATRTKRPTTDETDLIGDVTPDTPADTAPAPWRPGRHERLPNGDQFQALFPVSSHGGGTVASRTDGAGLRQAEATLDAAAQTARDRPEVTAARRCRDLLNDVTAQLARQREAAEAAQRELSAALGDADDLQARHKVAYTKIAEVEAEVVRLTSLRSNLQTRFDAADQQAREVIRRAMTEAAGRAQLEAIQEKQELDRRLAELAGPILEARRTAEARRKTFETAGSLNGQWILEKRLTY